MAATMVLGILARCDRGVKGMSGANRGEGVPSLERHPLTPSQGGVVMGNSEFTPPPIYYRWRRGGKRFFVCKGLGNIEKWTPRYFGVIRFFIGYFLP